MKKYITPFILSAILIMFNSCGESFLTKYPSDQITSGTFSFLY